jgi:hypothetical protein
VFLTGKYEHTANNVNEIKESTTAIDAFSLNFSLYPGGDLPTATIGFRSYGRQNDIFFPDTVWTVDEAGNQIIDYIKDSREDNINSSQRININYTLSALGLNHLIVFNYMNQNRIDQIRDRPVGAVPTDRSSKKIGINVKTQFENIPLVTKLDFNNQVQESPINVTTDGVDSVVVQRSVYNELGINATLRLFDNKLILQTGLNQLIGSEAADYSITNLTLNVTFRPIEHHQLSSSVKISNFDNRLIGKKYLDNVILFKYSYMF